MGRKSGQMSLKNAEKRLNETDLKYLMSRDYCIAICITVLGHAGKRSFPGKGPRSRKKVLGKENTFLCCVGVNHNGTDPN